MRLAITPKVYTDAAGELHVDCAPAIKSGRYSFSRDELVALIREVHVFSSTTGMARGIDLAAKGREVRFTELVRDPQGRAVSSVSREGLEVPVP